MAVRLRAMAEGCRAWRGIGRRAAAGLATLVVAGSWPAAASAQAMPAELAQAWRATKLPESALSLVIRELDGPALASVNPSVPRNPASVMKLVTTWAALSGLGPDYSWRTAFYTAGKPRIDAQGTLSGTLYLKASGDPLLTYEELWRLLRDLRLRGVKNLTDVVVDRSVFGRVAIDPSAFDNAGDRPYNASPDAMMVGLGAVRLLFLPDAQARRWTALLDPPVPGVRVQGDIEWRPGACPGSPSVATQVGRSAAGTTVTVSGAAVGDCGEFSLYRLATDQAAHFEGMFQMLWRELGGTLARGFKDGRLPANAQLLAWHDSEPLADVIRPINKQSNNVMARHMLLTLAAERSGPGATPRTGAAAALELLAGQRVNVQGWVLENGSGLSREERITAAGLADMLQAAWRSPLMPEFMSSMAIPGVDGTVRRRLRNDPARGMAHLKTGSLRDVRALGGYVLGASGKRYALVSLINHERSAETRAFHDAVVRWLAAR